MTDRRNEDRNPQPKAMKQEARLMNKDQWRQIEKIFYSAMELPRDERDDFVVQACVGDEELRQEVRALLAADRDAMSFLDSPVAMPPHSGTLSPTPAPPQVISNSNSAAESGLRVGHYRLLREIGRGGMGVVYEAEQQHPRRPVALKVIRGGLLVDEYQVKLFLRETRALARLKHPGIAAIYEAGCAGDGRHYFVMELVRGIPLLDYVKGRRLTGAQAPSNIRRRLELFLKICEAISYAHQRGVIHRDLKPTNILVANESEEQSLSGASAIRIEVKVLDFGLARITDEDGAGASSLSHAGQIRGTLPYMSPEQVCGEAGQIDVRADVYALGVILYELLTERLPYDLEHVTLPQAIRIISEEAPKPLSRAWSGSHDCESRKTERIDRDVETIVIKALEKDPERRYQSAAAMAEDVTRYMTNQPIRARPPSALYQFRKLVARRKVPFASLTAVFALLLGFAITMAAQSARIPSERDKVVLTLKGHEELVSPVAFSPDGKRLASSSADRTAKLWDAATGQELFTLKGHGGIVSSVAFSPDGKRLATWSLDHTARLWDTATGQELLTLNRFP
jgi:eukaryotic-like serine/threonine-protein kinase